MFGGTGASSIPIIPQAIAKAAEITSNGAANVLQSVYFGSTLLTAYFSFRQPGADELEKQKVIATSDKFALNSQVAMMFYDDDTTVKKTYQRFYMIGTDNMSWDPMERKGDATQQTITGGSEQKNDSHYIELLAAAAALDFYNADEGKLAENKRLTDTDYLYRAVGDDGRLDFADFVGTEREKEFCKKFGMLIVFALYCNGEDNFVESVRSGDQKEIQEFRDIDVNQVEALKSYFRLFFVRKNADGGLEEGWLRQVHRSAGGHDRFMFNAALFTPSSYKELMKMDWNDTLYRNEGTGKDNKFKMGLFGSKFNSFKKEFIEERDKNKSWQNITNKGEQLYKLVFDTLAKLYKFK